jgi:tripartite-type tricarboxylate transporter receptor subunit TctC
MNRMRCGVRLVVVCAVLSAWMGSASQAETYPTRPVKMIVQTAAGSSIDVAARIVAEGLARRWGQQVVVFNQPGAGGAIAARALASAPNDGYTLFFAASSVFVVLPEIQKSLRDDIAGFIPAAFIGETPMAVAVPANSPAQSIPALLELAKKTPGGLNAAVSTRGGLSHLSAEALRQAANIEFTFVHYPGTAQALTDVIADRVPLIVDSISALMGPAAGKQIKILGVASPQRLKALPDIPALSEFLPGFEATAWFALVAPAGTPRGVMDQVAEGAEAELRNPDLAKRLAEIGTFPRDVTRSTVAAFIQAQKEKWAPIVRGSGLEVR